MTGTGTRLERLRWKERQEALYADRDFVAACVVPLVPELRRNWDPLDWRVETVRSKASDRITIRYIFGSLEVIYGKVYFDPSLGRATHVSLARLWEQPFASGSGLEVPEPLGFVEQAKLLLIRRAEGTPLNELARDGSLDEALASVRLAARWLVKFHATKTAGLPVQSPCERIEIFKIADLLAKAAAECSEGPSLLISMLHDLQAVAPDGNASSNLVPLHGQFRPAHVFTDGSRATVIDIEKICVSDPAKDIARFVHSLKKACFEEAADVERADQLAREFVAEYEQFAPLSLENLAYFRALLAFKALTKILISHKGDENARRRIGEMYAVEFERATSGRALPHLAA
jgi:aminoglycoside phosphotransferase (APT) family kinase protein